MIKQLDLKQFWENTQLALRGKTGLHDIEITKEQVAEMSGVPLDYIVYNYDNPDNPLWGNPWYLAAVVEALLEIYGLPHDPVVLYWVDGEVK